MPAVLKDKQVLVFKLKNTEILTSKLPAQVVGNYVAVPHKTTSYKIARGCGLGVDGYEPIRFYYDWPKLSGNAPMAHQIDTAAFASVWSRCFIFNSMRTGKTASVLWAADALRKANELGKGRVLIVSTLSCTRSVWEQELYKLWPTASVGVLTGDKKARLKKLREPHDFYIINHDGVKLGAVSYIKGNKESGVVGRRFSLAGFSAELGHMVSSGEISGVIVDEGSEFRNSSLKNDALKAICEKAGFVWWLSGTPTPSGPMDAWGQLQIVAKHRVGSYTDWREKTMWQDFKGAWVPKDGWQKTVADVMQPAIRFDKADLFDLPPLTHQTLEVEMSPEHKKAYETMRKEQRLLVGDETISAVNHLALQQKLLQMACGLVKTDDGELIKFEHKNKIDELHRLVGQSEGKVIVFASYLAACDMLEKNLALFGAVKVTGAVTGRGRDDAFIKFKTDPEVKVLVAHPRTTSHGLEFACANTIVWYSPPQITEYEQAINRIQSIQQKLSMGIYYLVSTSLEKALYDALSAGVKSQNELLEIYKQEVVR